LKDGNLNREEILRGWIQESIDEEKAKSRAEISKLDSRAGFLEGCLMGVQVQVPKDLADRIEKALKKL